MKEENQFKIRFPKGKRQEFADLAQKNDRSLNSELLRRLRMSQFIPDDIAKACEEFGDVKDGLDFAVRLFKRAGISVEIKPQPKKKAP